MDFNWNIDAELVAKFKECNHVFCSRWDGIDTAKQYNSSVYRLQGGYNPKVHYPIDVPKVRDVAFIGERRADRVSYQKETGFEFTTMIPTPSVSTAIVAEKK